MPWKGRQLLVQCLLDSLTPLHSVPHQLVECWASSELLLGQTWSYTHALLLLPFSIVRKRRLESTCRESILYSSSTNFCRCVKLKGLQFIFQMFYSIILQWKSLVFPYRVKGMRSVLGCSQHWFDPRLTGGKCNSKPTPIFIALFVTIS